MVKGLLDTSILIDILRLHQPAQLWLTNQQELGVPSPAWLELIEGASNKSKLNHAIKLLKQFDHIRSSVDDIDWAIKQLSAYNLSHNVGGIDCLIAATSHRLQIPLYTMNLKHFRPIIGPLAQQPY
jgi:predicted nucleic acid-binding protein